MTFYLQEINRIRSTVYSNEAHLMAVIRTRRFINANFEKELSLEQLARAGFTSKFHLLRLFKRYYGQTPKQYLIHKRIVQSIACLKRGMTVTDTCFAVGFECPSSFSTLFKQKTGLSPAEFQKKQFLQSALAVL
ncbi:AraC family transcriptional regulator [Niabella sp. CC-SYL272]|uniref:helix-turn-helix domain-containing protein n=1 Tax=Niabella agricola TaxID=2891571 RepID=UPI001F2C1AA2|nr:AraC family transcriptional regulator [Niabella agricola]MCF3109242.1 AraC family transcriptional regulator [Niabella agricola]